MDFNSFYKVMYEMHTAKARSGVRPGYWANLNRALTALGFTPEEVQYALTHYVSKLDLGYEYDLDPSGDVMLRTSGLGEFAMKYPDVRVSFIMASLLQMGYR